MIYAFSLKPGHYDDVQSEFLDHLKQLIDKTVKNAVYFEFKDGKLQYRLSPNSTLYFNAGSRLSRLMGATSPHTPSPWVSYDALGVRNRDPRVEATMGLKPSEFVVTLNDDVQHGADVTAQGNVHLKTEKLRSDQQLADVLLLACRDLSETLENRLQKDTLVVMEEEPNLETIPKLYVYASNVHYVHVGNTEAPLLRIVLVKGKRGEHVHLEFQKVVFIPVLPSRISDFTIKITTEQGDVVDFTQGETVCTLIARQMV